MRLQSLEKFYKNVCHGEDLDQSEEPLIKRPALALLIHSVHLLLVLAEPKLFFAMLCSNKDLKRGTCYNSPVHSLAVQVSNGTVLGYRTVDSQWDAK